MFRPAIWIGAFAVAAALLSAILFPGAVRDAAADEPEITYISIQDGDVFAEPLQVIQICFREPIDVRDLPPLGEGDFQFSLQRPNGLRVGMRIVFQADGYGVAIYPGIIEEDVIGEWTFKYRVRDRETLDELSGSVVYEVQAGGDPIITPTPDACPSEGTPVQATTPPDPDGTPSPTEPGLDTNGDDDPDLLLLSLLTIGAAGGAGVIALFGFMIRRRVGWSLHKPSQKTGSDEEHH